MNLFRILPLFGLLATTFVLRAQPSIGHYHVYYGHLHNHSEVSDGIDSPEQAYQYAHDSGHLDFFCLTDHSDQIHGDEWESIQQAADKYNQPGGFTTFYGFEWTDYQLGHVTVINADDYTTPTLCDYNFSNLCRWLDQRDCIAFFNHPGRYNNTGHEFEHFEVNPCERFVGIELWNRTDRFELFYRNDGYYSDDGNKSWYDEALIRGWNIGASGSEDNHQGNYGNATNSKLAILAEENTREALFEALKAKRFFSTYDKNMALSFQINGSEMGSEIYAGNQALQIQATDENQETFAIIELIRNGEVIQSWSPNTDRVNIQQSMRCFQGDYYYLHVKQADGDEAITSPIWVSRVNQLPQASLLRPLPNSNFIIPSAVTFEAQAEDTYGDIEKVEFYVDDELVNKDYQSPYSFTWECNTAGTYWIKVRAIDNLGGEAVSHPVKVVVTSPGQPVTISSQVVTGMDDVEESSEGSITGNMKSTDIELVDDDGTRGGNQTVGIRFTELNIPQGVYITNAFIQFTCDEVSRDTCQLSIAGEAAGYSPAFTRDPYNLSERTLTGARVRWLPDPWLEEGEAAMAQRTPNLKSIVQEIINLADYHPEGAITLIFSGTGTRTAVSYEGKASAAPVMVVTYSYTKPNNPPEVRLTSLKEGSVYMAPAVIPLQADAFDTDGKIEKVDFYQGETLLNTEYYLPYAFEWSNVAEGNYHLKAVATDDNGDTTISRIISLTVVPQVISRTFTTRISSAPDDAEERYNGQVSLNDDDIELVYDSHCQGRQIIGLRFINVDIPSQAMIKKATIQFTCDEKTTAGCTLEIQGEDTDSSFVFNNQEKDISGRSRTRSAVGWRPVRWTRPGQANAMERTPDLKSIVQEIISRPGWSPGSSLSFIITGLGIGQRTAVSFETSPLKAARLTVDYEETIYRNKASGKNEQ
jgi:hypothetical protein